MRFSRSFAAFAFSLATVVHAENPARNVVTFLDGGTLMTQKFSEDSVSRGMHRALFLKLEERLRAKPKKSSGWRGADQIFRGKGADGKDCEIRVRLEDNVPGASKPAFAANSNHFSVYYNAYRPDATYFHFADDSNHTITKLSGAEDAVDLTMFKWALHGWINRNPDRTVSLSIRPVRRGSSEADIEVNGARCRVNLARADSADKAPPVSYEPALESLRKAPPDPNASAPVLTTPDVNDHEEF